MGERDAARADRRAGIGAHGGRRGDHQPGGGAHRRSGRRQAVGQLDGGSGASGRGRGALRHRARGGDRSVRRARNSIPVGKDSMSMRTTWRDGDADKAVTAPVSLIVSAFAPVADARSLLTPLLRLDAGDTLLLHSTRRTAGSASAASALAQVHGQLGDECPDVDDPARLIGILRAGAGAAWRRECCSPITTSATAASSSRWRKWRSPRAAASTSCCPPTARTRWRRCSRRSSAPSSRSRAGDAAAVLARGAWRGARRAGRRHPRGGDRIIVRHGDGNGARRGARRPAPRVVGDDARDAGAARQPAVLRTRNTRGSRDADDPGLAPRVGFAIDEDMPPRSSRGRRAPAGCDPARAGRERPGRDGGGVRPRRVSTRRRPHERPHRRPRSLAAFQGRRRRAADSRTATCWGQARAGRSRSCSTRGCATSSRRSSRAATPSRWAFATAAR